MITFYSFCWSVIMSSICIIILILFRRNSRFLLNFNLPTLLFLFLLCMIRMLIPFEFPDFQKIIDSHTYSFIMKPYAILSAHYYSCTFCFYHHLDNRVSFTFLSCL